MTRHAMRRNALLLVFEDIFVDYPVTEILELAAECDEIDLDREVESIFRGVAESTKMIDEMIARHLNKWTIDRISKISLAVLRVAIYEITSTNVQLPIIINEAVELTKEFSDQEDASFVNGVLGSFTRELEASKEVVEE